MTTPAQPAAPVSTVAPIREAEARATEHTTEDALMDKAARAVADAVAAELAAVGSPVTHARIVVLAGTGNNGGDALLAAAILAHEGADVAVVLVGATGHARGLAAADAAGADTLNAVAESGLRAAEAVLAEANVVIDGIAGIGSTPGLRPPAASLVEDIPPGAIVVSVDIPSGLDADSGAADHPHVKATVTVTFTALKPCLVTEPAASSAGRVIVADVGIAL